MVVLVVEDNRTLAGNIIEFLEAHGFDVKFGWPTQDSDMIGVWGRKRTSKRGRHVAAKRDLPLLTIEDSFLRSVRTGRQGAPSLGVIAVAVVSRTAPT